MVRTIARGPGLSSCRPVVGACRALPDLSLTRIESPMNVLADTVVTLTFELFDADGVLLESSQ